MSTLLTIWVVSGMIATYLSVKHDGNSSTWRDITYKELWGCTVWTSLGLIALYTTIKLLIEEKGDTQLFKDNNDEGC